MHRNGKLIQQDLYQNNHAPIKWLIVIIQRFKSYRYRYSNLGMGFVDSYWNVIFKICIFARFKNVWISICIDILISTLVSLKIALILIEYDTLNINLSIGSYIHILSVLSIFKSILWNVSNVTRSHNFCASWIAFESWNHCTSYALKVVLSIQRKASCKST